MFPAMLQTRHDKDIGLIVTIDTTLRATSSGVKIYGLWVKLHRSAIRPVVFGLFYEDCHFQ